MDGCGGFIADMGSMPRLMQNEHVVEQAWVCTPIISVFCVASTYVR